MLPPRPPKTSTKVPMAQAHARSSIEALISYNSAGHGKLTLCWQRECHQQGEGKAGFGCNLPSSAASSFVTPKNGRWVAAQPTLPALIR